MRVTASYSRDRRCIDNNQPVEVTVKLDRRERKIGDVIFNKITRLLLERGFLDQPISPADFSFSYGPLRTPSLTVRVRSGDFHTTTVADFFIKKLRRHGIT